MLTEWGKSNHTPHENSRGEKPTFKFIILYFLTYFGLDNLVSNHQEWLALNSPEWFRVSINKQQFSVMLYLVIRAKNLWQKMFFNKSIQQQSVLKADHETYFLMKLCLWNCVILCLSFCQQWIMCISNLLINYFIPERNLLHLWE